MSNLTIYKNKKKLPTANDYFSVIQLEFTTLWKSAWVNGSVMME